MKEAVQQHVQGLKGNTDESLLEMGEIQTFNGEEWLAEYPELTQHLEEEHCLHLRGVDEIGRGLHWEAWQHETGLNPKFNPEAHDPDTARTGIQMKLGYFIIPRINFELQISENLSTEIAKDLRIRDEKGEVVAWRFFVHPSAYAHYAQLIKAGIRYVPPSQSSFMGTPTSSYNAWLVRCFISKDSKPFIIKMGTPNGRGDIKHLFAGNDIIKSLKFQNSFDKLPENDEFLLFKETAGLLLEDIPGYPVSTIDSGIVIVEIPEQFLCNECKLVSLSALMSCERLKTENHGLAAFDSSRKELHKLPLVYELMDTAIQKGLVSTPVEFVQKYFIDAYLQAIEPLLRKGYSFGSQKGNLYVVLDSDNIIKGFAYRDFEGVALKEKSMKSYSQFYRYSNFVKLLNVMTQTESAEMPMLEDNGAGIDMLTSERSLYSYLYSKLEREDDYLSLEALKRLSIPPEESVNLLEKLDAAYLDLLRLCEERSETYILQRIPAAASLSSTSKALCSGMPMRCIGKVSGS